MTLIQINVKLDYKPIIYLSMNLNTPVVVKKSNFVFWLL